MITIDDVIGMTDLTEAEIDAVAEHECIPEAAAAALADYLMHQQRGPDVIQGMIEDDVRAALAAGRDRHAGELLCALRHFLHTAEAARAS